MSAPAAKRGQTTDDGSKLCPRAQTDAAGTSHTHHRSMVHLAHSHALVRLVGPHVCAVRCMCPKWHPHRLWRHALLSRDGDDARAVMQMTMSLPSRPMAGLPRCAVTRTKHRGGANKKATARGCRCLKCDARRLDFTRHVGGQPKIRRGGESDCTAIGRTR